MTSRRRTNCPCENCTPWLDVVVVVLLVDPVGPQANPAAGTNSVNALSIAAHFFLGPPVRSLVSPALNFLFNQRVQVLQLVVVELTQLLFQGVELDVPFAPARRFRLRNSVCFHTEELADRFIGVLVPMFIGPFPAENNDALLQSLFMTGDDYTLGGCGGARAAGRAVWSAGEGWNGAEGRDYPDNDR